MNVKQQQQQQHQHVMDGIFNAQERRGPISSAYLTTSSITGGSPNISSSSETTNASGARSRRPGDLRRTYAGTSPSVSLSPRNRGAPAAAPPPQQRPDNILEHLQYPTSSTMVVEPIYHDIEMRTASSSLLAQQHQRIEVHVPGSLRRARQRRLNVEESFRRGSKSLGLAEQAPVIVVPTTTSGLESKSSSHSDAGSAISGGQKQRRCVTDLLLNHSSGSGSSSGNLHKPAATRQQPQQTPNHLNNTMTTASTTTSTSNAREHMSRVELSASTENDELSELRTSSYVYTGPFDSEAALLMNYTTPAQQQRLQKQQNHGVAMVEPIVFRDDIASSSGSIMTGMSQQELLRKKARAAQRRNNKQPRRPKPLVHLPAALLLGTSGPSRRSPSRGYANADKQLASRSSRWNIVKHLSRTRSDELESSTAETTQDDPSLPNGTAAPPGSFAAAVAPRDTDRMVLCSMAPSNQQPPENAERYDKEGPYFSLLSSSVNNISISMNNDSGTASEDNEALTAASAWMMNREVMRPPKNNSSSTAANNNNNDASSQVSSTSSAQRRGVRFAENLEEDDESQPWDQRKDSAAAKGDQSSPASGLDNLRLGNHQSNGAFQKPKSILRPSRFTMDNPAASRYYGTERRALDFESLRLVDRVASTSQDLEVDALQLPISSDDFESGERLMVDYDLVKRAAARTSFSQHLDLTGTVLEGIKLDVSTDCGRQPRTLEVPPPWEGFLDASGSEISSIRSIQAGRSVTSGHSAGKHLHESIASVCHMHRGDNAARVIDEDYPDPPTILDMDDDETVLSAFVFIKTVAAIVIQAAARRFLAIRRVAKMKKAKHILLTKLVDLNTSSVTKSMSLEDDNFRFNVSVQTEENSFATDMYELAAVYIQSAFRGFWVRDCLDVDHYCATAIQTAYRTSSCRKKYIYVLSQIVTVQSWWRRNIARDLAADTLAYVIFIQAVFRGFRVRRRFKAYSAKKMHVRTMATTVIQAKWRSFVSESHFIRLLVDVLIVQTIVRRWLAGRGAAALRKKRQTKAARWPSVKQQSSVERLSLSNRAGRTEREVSILPLMQQSKIKADPQRQKARALPKRTVAALICDVELQQSPTDETDGCTNDRRRRNPDPPGFMRKPVVGTLDQSAMSSDEPDPLSTSQILADIGAEESALIEAGKFWNVTLASSKSTDSGDRKSKSESTTKNISNKPVTKQTQQKPSTNPATLTPSKASVEPSKNCSNTPVESEKRICTNPDESSNKKLAPCKSADSEEDKKESSSSIQDAPETKLNALTASASADSADNQDRPKHSSKNDHLLSSAANDSKIELDASSGDRLKSGDCNEKSNVASGPSKLRQDRTGPVADEGAWEVGIANAVNPWNVTLTPVKRRDATGSQSKPDYTSNGGADSGKHETVPAIKGENLAQTTNSAEQCYLTCSTSVSTDSVELVTSESTAKAEGAGDHRHVFVAKGKKHIVATRVSGTASRFFSPRGTNTDETTSAEGGKANSVASKNNSPLDSAVQEDPSSQKDGNSSHVSAKTTNGAVQGIRAVVAYPEHFLKAKEGPSLLKQLIQSDQNRIPTSTDNHSVGRIAGVSDPEVFIPLSPPRATSVAAAVSPQRSIGTQTSIEDVIEEETETNDHGMGTRPSVLSIWREREKKAKSASSTVMPT